MKLIFAIVTVAIALNAANCEMLEFLQTHLVLNEAELLEVAKMANECKTETKIPNEIFAQLKNGELPDVREFKCFLKCFSLKFGTLAPNGDINLSPLETTVRKKQYDVMAVCSKIQHEDECQRVFEIYKCYVGKLKKDNVVL